MAVPPRFSSFRAEDYKGAPEWFETFIKTLNETLTALSEGLDKGLTRGENLAAAEKVGFAFTWNGSAVEVKNTLSTQPNHVTVTDLYRDDDEALSDPWSMTWQLSQNGMIQMMFQGLTVSTKYNCSITYE